MQGSTLRPLEAYVCWKRLLNGKQRVCGALGAGQDAQDFVHHPFEPTAVCQVVGDKAVGGSGGGGGGGGGSSGLGVGQ